MEALLEHETPNIAAYSCTGVDEQAVEWKGLGEWSERRNEK